MEELKQEIIKNKSSMENNKTIKDEKMIENNNEKNEENIRSNRKK